MAASEALGNPIEQALAVMTAWQRAALGPGDLQAEVVRGGLTNVLTRVFISSSALARIGASGVKPHEILLRQFGLGTDDLIDRRREEVVFRYMSDIGVGVQLYGLFPGGRGEGFLHGRTLISADLQLVENGVRIAQQLARVHKAEPPISRDNVFRPSFMRWWMTAATATMPTPAKRLKVRQFDLAELHAEMLWLLNLLEASGSPVLFTHNDLLAGNVMELRDSSIVLLDFEYAGYSYRGFDFGNHFAEMTIHYNVDAYPCFYIQPDHYPGEAFQRAFFAAYLDAMGVPKAEHDAQIPQLVREAQKFALASHFQWALWGIVQASRSTIAFGFLEFSAARFDQYYALKAAWKLAD